MKYLFCYFVGNRPEEESVHFAVSSDGYNFEALNENEPVIKQKLGKKCCRDPYIFRDKSSFSLDCLRPRHGSVMHITDEEYERLVSEFTSRRQIE